MSERRPARVAQLVQAALGRLLLQEARDRRLHDVIVTDVRMTPDLKLARVWVRHLAVRPEAGPVMAALARATPFLRSRLGAEAGLRWVPELRFEYDRLIDDAARVERLLDRDTPPEDES